MPRKIIFDTDPGVDDAMAIQLLLASPEFDLVGMTTVFGNTNVDQCTINALRLLHLAGRDDVPVAKGASQPLNGKFGGGVPYVHGEDGQGNTYAPESPRSAVLQPAYKLINELVNQHPGEITLVAVGPLTNLAILLHHHPEIVEKVAEVIVMGGNIYCPGNITPAAEANIFNDPEAADRVFGAGWPITLIGLDVTHQVFMPEAAIYTLKEMEGAINQFVASAVPYYLNFFKNNNQIEGIFVHDSSTLAYLLHPELFKAEKYPVRVDTSQSISRGKTWIASSVSDSDSPFMAPWQNRQKVNVCYDVAGDKVAQLIVERLQIPIINKEA